MRFHYFWINGAVQEVDQNAMNAFIQSGEGADQLCVDCGASEPATTYGFYNKNGSWHHVPYDEFPAEFKTHLLLLGITP